ncbi:MAG: bifunctional ornithine acetyltransferase/N-acetylglutamate synthase [Nitrospirae bacterium RIFCSPLOWO2_02_FULL_62_14]|nr:MAG: bifunctional ornithine acetyltransferase/N-acetylglutamate synthase [Nitrospirae bacterium RIFCSPLOWO2_02_FULL_62_14]OGW67991.1 MAG: bifunctional ornithine acetyltransferase/N-acetylglutamate synthase [Nitrospirae bacterium RIFCSPLOWO2_01_FULL_62_17]
MTRHFVTTVRGGVTAPRGFTAAGIHCGIKKKGLPDLALLVSERPGPVAGVFTTNRVAAAPVQLGRLYLKKKTARAVIVNSGCANAFTGARGMVDAKEMAELVARRMNIPAHTVFVGSTGVIGRTLPMPRIRRGMSELVRQLRRAGGHDAARAIMTTDLRPKEVAYSARIDGRMITVGGMAKGSGMIHPDMATMLAYVTTDAAIEHLALQQALAAAVAKSFNCISVDGDSSTNDTVLCLANGLAGNPVLRKGSAALAAFQQLLDRVCLDLAMKIIHDGEGVTKVVKLAVTGARTPADAKQVARTIGTSLLVKTALFGEDANWGRIVAALGRAGVAIDPRRIGLAFNGVPMVKAGRQLGPRAQRKIDQIVKNKEFTITVDLGLGSSSATLWITDLSYEYVKINASYRT